jgi:hypothetical protein
MLEQGLAQLAVPSDRNASTFDFGAFLLALPAEANAAGLTGQQLAFELEPIRTPHEMDRRFLLEFLTQMSVNFGGTTTGIGQGCLGLSTEERTTHESNQRLGT